MTDSKTRLICGRCEPKQYLLPSTPGRVTCPNCKESWQDFIKHPVALVMKKDGTLIARNVLTGEQVERTTE